MAIPCSEAFSGGFGGRYCKAVLQYYSWHFPAFFFLVLYKEKKRVTTITVRATTYRNRWEKSSRFYLFVFSKQTCRLICSTPESEAKLGRKRAQNRPHPSLSTTASTSPSFVLVQTTYLSHGLSHLPLWQLAPICISTTHQASIISPPAVSMAMHVVKHSLILASALQTQRVLAS